LKGSAIIRLKIELGKSGYENAATVNMMGAVSPAALPIPKTEV
jgi:hypothetical protein